MDGSLASLPSFVSSWLRPITFKSAFARLPDLQSAVLNAAGSAGGISPPAAHRTVRKPLDLHGSSQSFSCHLTMANRRRRSRLIPVSRLATYPSLNWVIPFAPSSLQELQHYYGIIRPIHAH